MPALLEMKKSVILKTEKKSSKLLKKSMKKKPSMQSMPCVNILKDNLILKIFPSKSNGYGISDSEKFPNELETGVNQTFFQKYSNGTNKY